MGWIVKPPSFDPSKKYPLILEIHGGPFGNYNVGVQLHVPELRRERLRRAATRTRAAAPATAASSSNGIDHNYPGPDYDDLMAGVDTVVGKGYVDTSRMYVVGLQRRRRAFELGDRPHRSLRGGGGALPGDRLDQHGRAHRHPALHLQLLQEAVLGRSVRLARALVADVGRQGDDADAADDGRARSADADAADRGVLRGAEGERRAGRSCCSSTRSITAPDRSRRTTFARSST